MGCSKSPATAQVGALSLSRREQSNTETQARMMRHAKRMGSGTGSSAKSIVSSRDQEKISEGKSRR